MRLGIGLVVLMVPLYFIAPDGYNFRWTFAALGILGLLLIGGAWLVRRRRKAGAVEASWQNKD
jgi:LPXTG-motif cell wall-anchored protein